MKITHGPHVSTTRNHGFSYEEETKTTLPSTSGKDLSFLSSNSCKFSHKFKTLSIKTYHPNCIDSIRRDSKDSAGPSRGDDECPEENEFVPLSGEKVSSFLSTEKYMDSHYILPGFY